MGVAIYVPGVDYSQNNLGSVTLTDSMSVTGMTISGPVTVPGNATYKCIFSPVFTTQRGVVWSITSGSQYASIDQNGLLSAEPEADANSVTIRATSTIDANIYAEKTVTVIGSLEYYDWIATEDVNAKIFIPKPTGLTNNDALVFTLTFIPEMLNGYLFGGGHDSSAAGSKFAAYLNSSNKMSYVLGRSGYQNAVTKATGIKYKYIYEVSGYNGNATYLRIYNADTDELLHTSSAYTSWLDSDLGLFGYGYNQNGSGTSWTWGSNGIGKIYGFSIEKNQEKVLDLVPVSVSGVGAMLDTLTGTIYRNSSDSGTIIFGND